MNPSPWPARIALFGVYLIWIGSLWHLSQMDGEWSGLATSFLLVLLWLPYDFYRKRREWLAALPLQLAMMLAVFLTLVMVTWRENSANDHDLAWHSLRALAGAVYAGLQLWSDRILAHREQARWQLFMDERRRAPKVKPVIRFAGKPNPPQ